MNRDRETNNVVALKPNFETTLKLTSKKQDVIEQVIEYLKMAFEVEPTSQRMFNCETGVYFQYLSLSPKEA